MAKLSERRIMQMRLSPEDVGRAVGLFIAAKCGEAIPHGGKIRMDYFFDKKTGSFVEARARLEVL